MTTVTLAVYDPNSSSTQIGELYLCIGEPPWLYTPLGGHPNPFPHGLLKGAIYSEGGGDTHLIQRDQKPGTVPIDAGTVSFDMFGTLPSAGTTEKLFVSGQTTAYPARVT